MARLQEEPLIAVDTESNSLYAYYQRVCLIQISTRGGDWVIDPLVFSKLDLLAPIFANPNIEKVFHAAEYDIMCLKRDFEFTFSNLFDTMVSGRILGMKLLGLGNMLETFFGVRVDKKYQRADWSVRPIPVEQLRYAQHDTHYLLDLRDVMIRQMEEKGCLVEAREVFNLMTEIPAAAQYTFDMEGYWRINRARDLDRRQMAILRELYLWRDDLAAQLDRPPFKVATDETLVAIAVEAPTTTEALKKVLGRHSVMQYHTSILSAVKEGLVAKFPQRPTRDPRLDPVTQARYDALHEWRKARAMERGVESDVIIPRESLWAMARTSPRTPEDLTAIPGMGPWKRERYGAELLALLAGFTE